MNQTSQGEPVWGELGPAWVIFGGTNETDPTDGSTRFISWSNVNHPSNATNWLYLSDLLDTAAPTDAPLLKILVGGRVAWVTISGASLCV